MSTETALADIALTAALAGAAAIRSVLDAGALGTEFKTAGHDMVTAADKGSERAILAVLRNARPDDSILGEEGGSHAGSSPVRWLVDPLDGTANFVYGRADYAVSVGAVVDGHPAAGAIIRPADGRWLAGESAAPPGPVGSAPATTRPPATAVRCCPHASVASPRPWSRSGCPTP